jgi:hypothetical protein
MHDDLVNSKRTCDCEPIDSQVPQLQPSQTSRISFGRLTVPEPLPSGERNRPAGQRGAQGGDELVFHSPPNFAFDSFSRPYSSNGLKRLKESRCTSFPAHFQVRGGRQWYRFWAALGESRRGQLKSTKPIARCASFASSPLAPEGAC